MSYLKNKKKKFSLIIPCYNEEGNIKKLINSCREIFFIKGFELILVNNCSTDNSQNVLNDFKNNLKLR